MKKGFTLVEVIAIITILGILLLIITPNVVNNINDTKNKTYERQILSIEDAAKRWGTNNSNKISDKYYLEISTLVDEDYLVSNEIIDPRNSKFITGCIIINYLDEYDQYKYTFTERSCSSLGVN